MNNVVAVGAAHLDHPTGGVCDTTRRKGALVVKKPGVGAVVSGRVAKLRVMAELASLYSIIQSCDRKCPSANIKTVHFLNPTCAPAFLVGGPPATITHTVIGFFFQTFLLDVVGVRC